MLRTRIATGLAMAVALLSAIFFLTQWQWAILVALLSTIAGWEWASLLGFNRRSKSVFALSILLACIALTWVKSGWLQPLQTIASIDSGGLLLFYGVIGLFWFLVVPICLRYRLVLKHPVSGSIAGYAVIIPTWLAMVQLRTLGALIFLSLLSVVFLADIAAYATGRIFGRRKLAPDISSGKTWEGAVGAAVIVTLFGLLVSSGLWGEQTLNSGDKALAWPILAFLLLALTAVSIFGDLFESLLKRQAGSKDSGNWLPGHGGLLDRIDALSAALPCMVFLWIYLDLSYA